MLSSKMLRSMSEAGRPTPQPSGVKHAISVIESLCALGFALASVGRCVCNVSVQEVISSSLHFACGLRRGPCLVGEAGVELIQGIVSAMSRHSPELHVCCVHWLTSLSKGVLCPISVIVGVVFCCVAVSAAVALSGQDASSTSNDIVLLILLLASMSCMRSVVACIIVAESRRFFPQTLAFSFPVLLPAEAAAAAMLRSAECEQQLEDEASISTLLAEGLSENPSGRALRQRG